MAFVPRTIAVLGAGAVGCYYGALLARAGREVTLIGRPVHVDAISRHGLRVQESDGPWDARPRAVTDLAVARDADLVLVTVKTLDTADAARALLPHLREDARVASLQNGVDNAARIAAVIAQPVYAAVVYVGAYMEGPGVVRHSGGGDLVFGMPRRGGDALPAAAPADADGDLRAIASIFTAAGVNSTISPDIEAALWTKLTINCAFNAVSALGNARYGRMAGLEAIRAVMEEAVREVVAVGQAAGVALDAHELIARVWQVAATMPRQYSSTAQDLERGKATEIDSLNGFIARRGAGLGVATPVNRTLHALVKLREPALER